MTTVIHVKDRTYASNEVYIGRPSIWGNPFKIGKNATREQVIKLYEEYLKKHPALMKQLPDLVDKVLVCWCKPEACHGDILAKYANELSNRT